MGNFISIKLCPLIILDDLGIWPPAVMDESFLQPNFALVLVLFVEHGQKICFQIDFKNYENEIPAISEYEWALVIL